MGKRSDTIRKITLTGEEKRVLRLMIRIAVEDGSVFPDGDATALKKREHIIESIRTKLGLPER